MNWSHIGKWLALLFVVMVAPRALVADQTSQSPPNGISLGSDVQIRQAPSLTAPVLGVLDVGDKVFVLGESASKTKIDGVDYPWLEISKPASLRGWVSARYIQRRDAPLIAAVISHGRLIPVARSTPSGWQSLAADSSEHFPPLKGIGPGTPFMSSTKERTGIVRLSTPASGSYGFIKVQPFETTPHPGTEGVAVSVLSASPRAFVELSAKDAETEGVAAFAHKRLIDLKKTFSDQIARKNRDIFNLEPPFDSHIRCKFYKTNLSGADTDYFEIICADTLGRMSLDLEVVVRKSSNGKIEIVAGEPGLSSTDIEGGTPFEHRGYVGLFEWNENVYVVFEKHQNENHWLCLENIASHDKTCIWIMGLGP